MVVIRPIRLDDLEALFELASLTGFGLTTLPRDRDVLRKRITNSRRSFEDMETQPRDDSYLFVLEDLDARRVVGACAIIAKVGGFQPLYAYSIETSIYESPILNLRKEIRVLHLEAEHDGPTEIGTLFLHPDYRKDHNGRLLSLSRFLFMAEFPDCFESMVIAEMRGVIDDRGNSAFWDGIGKHFFDIDFPQADYLRMVNKRFIADLMPRHPIYVTLLPQEAQNVIGKVHDQTVPALRLLEQEGFQSNGMVDIFEAGPIVTAPLRIIRTIKQSQKMPVVGITDLPITGEPMLVSNTISDFRAARGTVEVIEGHVRLERPLAEALQVRIGDPVRFAPLRGPSTPSQAASIPI